MECATGDILIPSGRLPTHIYFPITAIVSLMLDLEDGSGVEFALVGREGLVGFFLFVERPNTRSSAVVQCAGSLLRLKADLAAHYFDHSPTFRRGLMDYMQFLVTEAAQNSSCYRHHSIEQQLCRCLLTYMDRQQSLSLALTHETIARTLGVRREGVTLAARKLSDLGFIRYARGQIEIISAAGLRAHSCECYRVLNEMRGPPSSFIGVPLK